MSLQKPIVVGTLVAGALDILWAAGLATMAGRTPIKMLQGIASGPFGRWPLEQGVLGAMCGLVTHVAIMAVMATVFMTAVSRFSFLLQRPWLGGITYGLALYAVMYWLVLPLRWPALFPQTGAHDVLMALFAHIVLVGLPLAYIAQRALPVPPVT